MCGFAGVLKNNAAVSDQILTQMIAKIKHRGPDDQGIWIENNIGLAHARLSILDLSAAGHQPMFSFSKRFVIAFNGEIYNYLVLKKELEQQFSCVFVTHSDTEVLVNAIEWWGIEKTLVKCTGMFAFAAWDRQEKILYLARDRFGEKPLYYGNVAGDFVFSSELKPIQAVYKDQLHINRDALATYMRYCYIPAPYSIYQGINKLEPGTYLTIGSSLNVCQKSYWSAIDAALLAKKNASSISFQEAADQLENKLKRTLSRQMLSDVPLGAFLSGGIDSSTVVAIMQALSNKPIQTFSIGFNEKKYDESKYAREVANYLGVEHTELYVTDKDAMSVIPLLGSVYDEPFADSSQIPTFLVSKLAKQRVTVALSGDGGDEIFGGYSRYYFAHRVKKILGNPVINVLISRCPERFFNLLSYIPQNKISDLAGKFKKIQHMAKLLRGSFSGIYNGFCTQSYPKDGLVLQSNEIDIIGKSEYCSLAKYLSEKEWMMLMDALTYLVDDIMVKVDRAAMAVSLETRAPLLDHEIFEFAWSLPEEYKVINGKGKLILREVLHRYVPKHLVDRPKKGFGIPYAEWLRGGLAEWVRYLLDESKLRQEGYLNVPLVKKYVDEHLSGKRDRQAILWNILIFQQWLSEL